MNNLLARAQKVLSEGKAKWISGGKLAWSPEFCEAALYVMDGGKGARPALLLWSAAAGEKQLDPSSSAARTNWHEPALAIEMVHVYSLIHDDLPSMDNDDYRRGKETLHKKYSEALAVLTGDALLTGAFEVIAGAKVSADRQVMLVKELAHAAGAAGMIAGQLWDIEAEKSGSSDLKLWTKIHDAKTGALFGAALAMGFIAGSESVSEASVLAVREWGIRLGRLFQIVDDRLDKGPFYKTLGEQKLQDLCRDEAKKLRADALQIWSEPLGLDQILDFFINRQA